MSIPGRKVASTNTLVTGVDSPCWPHLMLGMLMVPKILDWPPLAVFTALKSQGTGVNPRVEANWALAKQFVAP